MQGRQGRDQDNDPWDEDRSISQQLPPSNGTGKQRAIPRRPPGMVRVDAPPTRRVGRPPREDVAPRSRLRRILIWGSIFVVCGIIAFVIGRAVVSTIQATNVAAPSAGVATDFMFSISKQDYNQAWSDLGAPITLHPLADFLRLAKLDDTCYSSITDFNVPDNNASTVSQDNKIWTYSYNITRSKLSQPYLLTLTLQQDLMGNWKVTAFSNGSGGDNDLGPANTPCVR